MTEPAELTEFQRRMLKPPSKKVIGILVALGTVLITAAGLTIEVALCPETPVAARWLFGLLAATLLFLPVRTAWVCGRRKWKTGRWSPTIEERLEMRRKWSTDGLASRGKVFKIGMTVFWVLFVGATLGMELRGWGHHQIFHPAVMVFMAVANLWMLHRKPKCVPRS